MKVSLHVFVIIITGKFMFFIVIVAVVVVIAVVSLRLYSSNGISVGHRLGSVVA